MSELSKFEEQDLRDRVEQLSLQLKQEKERADQEKERADQAEKQVEYNATLAEFVNDCHDFSYKKFKRADSAYQSSGPATNINGRRYPIKLCRWDNFSDWVISCFSRMKEVLGSNRVLPKTTSTRDWITARKPTANEQDITWYHLAAVVSPVKKIFE